MTSTDARGSGSLQLGAFKISSNPNYFVEETDPEFVTANMGVTIRRVDKRS